MASDTADAAGALMADIDRTVVLDRLACLHVIDSRWPGATASTAARTSARALLGHPALQGLPAVLEVSGTDNHGPDRRELAAVRRLHAEGLRLYGVTRSRSPRPSPSPGGRGSGRSRRRS